jgi:hypothetical protein
MLIMVLVTGHRMAVSNRNNLTAHPKSEVKMGFGWKAKRVVFRVLPCKMTMNARWLKERQSLR